MKIIYRERYYNSIILINIPCVWSSSQSGEIDWPVYVIQSERHNQKFSFSFQSKQPETKECDHRCTDDYCRFFCMVFCHFSELVTKLYSLVDLISTYWKDIRKPKTVLHGHAFNRLWLSSKPKMMDFMPFVSFYNFSHWRRNIVLFFVCFFLFWGGDVPRILWKYWPNISKMWRLNVCFWYKVQYALVL